MKSHNSNNNHVFEIILKIYLIFRTLSNQLKRIFDLIWSILIHRFRKMFNKIQFKILILKFIKIL